MKRFKQLLVHLDLEGTHDAAAIRYASAVSRLGHSRRVVFVHTSSVPSLFAATLNESPARTAAWLRQAKAEVERLIRRHFRGPTGCRAQAKVLGDAGFHDLLDQLRHQATDLIIVGKRDTNSAFVEKLARKAPCSVMVVPPGRSVAYRRILVTTDFSDHSVQALEVAVAFAKARKLKRLSCFHSYQIPYGHHKTGIPREQFLRETEAWAWRRFEEVKQSVDFGGLIAELVCRESPAVAGAILKQTKQLNSDLLVMGARGMDAFAAALLGSNTAQVVRETKIPALVVKPKGAGRALLDLLCGS